MSEKTRLAILGKRAKVSATIPMLSDARYLVCFRCGRPLEGVIVPSIQTYVRFHSRFDATNRLPNQEWTVLSAEADGWKLDRSIDVQCHRCPQVNLVSAEILRAP